MKPRTRPLHPGVTILLLLWMLVIMAATVLALELIEGSSR